MKIILFPIKSLPQLPPFGRLVVALALGVLVTLFACAKTIVVTIPPRVDLKAYQAIGVIEFAAPAANPALGPDVSEKFLGNIQGAQPGVRLLELGSREQVLREVGQDDLDYRAIRAIGEKYGVDAIITGSIELSEARPDISFSPNLTSISAQAKVDGKMNAKLWEAVSGATVWTNSSWGNWSVAGVSLSANGRPRVGISTPKEKQDQIVMALIKALNGDFWPTYEKRKVKD